MAHSKFFHYFPIPSFLLMRAVGLSIDDSCIRFVQIEDKDGEISVSKYGMVEIPPQSVVEGEIINAEAVSSALASLRSRHGAHFCKLALPDNKAYVFKMTLPAIPEKEIRSALEFKLDENVPLSASDAVFDYVVVSSSESSGIDVVVCAVAGSTSESYDGLFKSSGLQPLRFGLESQAVANAVVPQDEKGTVVVINFLPRKTTVSIVENNIVQFCLTMRNDELGVIGKAGNSSSGESSSGDNRPRDLSAVKQEFDRVLNYWHSINASGAEAHHKVIICGAEALNAEFVERFSGILGTPVVVADPWCNVFSGEARVAPISKEESFEYAAAIGLTLGYGTSNHRNV